MRVVPYLNFNGQCREALQFYAQCLRGDIVDLLTHEGSPMANDVSPEWRDKIMHGRLRLGNWELMASDAPPEYYRAPQGMWVSLQLEDPAEAERIFHALAEQGSVSMPMKETFWAIRFGMLTDRFGIPWIINCEQPSN